MKYKVVPRLIILIFMMTTCYGQNDDVIREPSIFTGVQKDSETNLYGILDINLEVSVPFEYEELSPVVSDFMIAKKNGKCGVINSRNGIV